MRRIKDEDQIELFQHGKWRTVAVRRVGSRADEVDVAVLTAADRITPVHPLVPSADEIYLSQDVYFLGFPYGWKMDALGQINNGYPIPFVKKAIVSAFLDSGSKQQILLDGHNNPGFSGGPVFCVRAGSQNEFRVVAVVSGFKFKRLPILQGSDKTQFEYEYNTGVVVTYSIKAALELIAANPIGCKVS